MSDTVYFARMDTHSMDHTLAGHIFLFLTTMAGFIFQWLREARQHRWQQEQFADVRRDIKNGHV